VGMGLSSPQGSLVLLGACTFLVAFGSATQDVVVDGWRIDAAPGLAPRFDFVQAVKAPVIDLFRRYGTLLWPILLLVALYRLPDFVANVMANPLYIDLGFRKSDIATVSKVYGVWIGIVGAFVGGFMVTWAGLRPTLITGGILCAASNLTYSWLTVTGPSVAALTVAVSVDNFSASFAGTALIAYMSGLTAPGFVATQYALLSSLYALPGKVVGGISGFMVQAYGYSTFFALTSLVGIPVVLLAWWVTRERAGAAPQPQEAPS
jgi:MFS transporter, PAT family, beta-lactamase induction signal transducer AmpG